MGLTCPFVKGGTKIKRYFLSRNTFSKKTWVIFYFVAFLAKNPALDKNELILFLPCIEDSFYFGPIWRIIPEQRQIWFVLLTFFYLF